MGTILDAKRGVERYHKKEKRKECLLINHTNI